MDNQDQLVQFEELALGSRLKRLSDHMMKEASKIYTELHIDFDPYHMPLFKLVSEQDSLTIGTISELLNVTQPAVTQYINALVKKNFIVTHTDKYDKRKKKIAISKSGKIMLSTLQPIWKIIDEEIKLLTHNPINKTLLDHISFIENELKRAPLSSTVLVKFKH